MAWLIAFIPPIFVVAIIVCLELRSGRGVGDWRQNLQAWAINLVAGPIIAGLVGVWHGPALIDGAALPAWLGIALFIVVQDLGEYLFHRAQHSVPFLWAMHSLHHSDPDMSVLTTSRHFWGDRLFKTATVWSGAAMVISATPAAMSAYFVASLWNFVAHANLRIDFGKWSWLLNSPAYHRRHHSRLPEHYDSNFAALLPIFDVLFGSYHRPRGYPPSGLDQRPARIADLLLWPLIYSRRRAAVETRPVRQSTPDPKECATADIAS